MEKTKQMTINQKPVRVIYNFAKDNKSYILYEFIGTEEEPKIATSDTFENMLDEISYSQLTETIAIEDFFEYVADKIKHDGHDNFQTAFNHGIYNFVENLVSYYLNKPISNFNTLDKTIVTNLTKQILEEGYNN